MKDKGIEEGCTVLFGGGGVAQLGIDLLFCLVIEKVGMFNVYVLFPLIISLFCLNCCD